MTDHERQIVSMLMTCQARIGTAGMEMYTNLLTCMTLMNFLPLSTVVADGNIDKGESEDSSEDK